MFNSTMKWTLSTLIKYLIITVLITVKLSDEKFILKADLEQICHHFYMDRFVFAAEVYPEQCWITCYLLNSDNHAGDIFDAVDVKNHTLPDGTPCNKRHMCVNGTCTRFYNNGTLYIIINEVILNDTYTEVTYGQHIELRIKLNGKPVVTKSPNDKKELAIMNVNRESNVTLEIANSIKKRELIAFIDVIIKDIISMNNGTVTQLMTPVNDNKVIINYTFNWIEYKSKTV